LLFPSLQTMCLFRLFRHMIPMPPVGTVRPSTPRTQRKKDRRRFLAVPRSKRPGQKKIRKTIRQQLWSLRRDLGYIHTLNGYHRFRYFPPVCIGTFWSSVKSTAGSRPCMKARFPAPASGLSVSFSRTFVRSSGARSQQIPSLVPRYPSDWVADMSLPNGSAGPASTKASILLRLYRDTRNGSASTRNRPRSTRLTEIVKAEVLP